MPEKRKLIADVILIASLIAVAVAIFLSALFSASDGSVAEVYVDGELAFSVPLDTDGEYSIRDGGNVIAVENGFVYMKAADCPDGLCIHQGRISKSGERIVCLPNRVLIQTEGEE